MRIVNNNLLRWAILLYGMLGYSVHAAFSDPLNASPLDHAGEKMPSIVIGIPQDIAKNDILGEPLTEEEFSRPIMPVDPPADNQDTDLIANLDYFEGDIFVRSFNELKHLTEPKHPLFRSVVTGEHKLWPDGKVPYVISAKFTELERRTLAFAIRDIQESSCIRFQEKTDANLHYVHFIKGEACLSAVGRTTGVQVITLNETCLTKGVALHELMHCLGFYHEQSRPDRDEHVTIIWDNILKGLEHNFLKYGTDRIENNKFGKYDLDSIMHYSSVAFSKSKTKFTIVPINGNRNIGQRLGLSRGDVKKINKLYKCSERGMRDSCSDWNTACPGIANPRECEKSAWMRENCPRTCRLCTPQTVTTNKEHAISSKSLNSPSISGIVEENKCPFWAAVGECDKNSKYMLKYCKKECQLHRDKPDCEDQNSKCGKWAAGNECQKNESYMHIFCAKSCNLCKN